jgi:hypothetical protein
LQRVEALVGVLYRRLQIAVLLLESFLVMAQSIVVADLPQHTAVGANRRDHGNTPDNRQSRDAVENIGRHDHFPEFSRGRSNVERIVLVANHNGPSGLAFIT